MSEEEELYEVYGLPVTEVPTHRPRIRTDHPPIVYFRWAVGLVRCPRPDEDFTEFSTPFAV